MPSWNHYTPQCDPMRPWEKIVRANFVFKSSCRKLFNDLSVEAIVFETGAVYRVFNRLEKKARSKEVTERW